MSNNKEQEDVIEVLDSSNLSMKIWIFSNEEIIPFFLAFGIGLCIAFSSNLGVPKVVAYSLAVIPLLLIIGFYTFFVHGKTPHYAEDVLDNLRKQRNHEMHSDITLCPDGSFFDYIILWNNNTYSFGMELLIPSVDYAKAEDKNSYRHRLDSIFKMFTKEGIKFQIYWTVDNDYNDILDSYSKNTDSLNDGKCKEYRQVKQEALENAMYNRQLRRERLFIYFQNSIPNEFAISSGVSIKKHDEQMQKICESLNNNAKQVFVKVKTAFSTLDAMVKVLSKDELGINLSNYFNPSRLKSPNLFSKVFNTEQSVMEQIWQSQISPKTGASSFILDNEYFCVLTLKTPLPHYLRFGLINELTKQNINDYSITVNITPLDVNRELHKEEDSVSKLKRQMATGNDTESVKVALSKRSDIASALADGRVVPVEIQYIIVLHSSSEEELQINATLLKGALSKMNLSYNVITYPRSAFNVFFQAIPGWIDGVRKKHCIRTLDNYIGCLIPFSTTYTGALKNAEAIYDGEQNNIIGLKQFADNISKDSDPQHSIIFGKTGSGKSVQLKDLIMQTSDFYDYSAIIDYGLSYEECFLKNFGIKPIRLSAQGNITINYFDTCSLPVTGEHLNNISMLLKVMSNEIATDGMIMRYLKPFFLSFANNWLINNRDKENQLVQIAKLQQEYLDDRICEDETEAFLQAKAENLTALSSLEVAQFLYDNTNKEKVLFLAFAFMDKREFPTHSLFVQYLRGKPYPDEENTIGLQNLADALELWNAGGKNGKLFDGFSNIDLNNSFEYFDLSKIPQDPHFKFAAGALIHNMVIKKIETMPREKKKRLIIDEANSLLELPQGAKMIENGYTKFRKHRCPLILAMQQYDMLKNTEISKSILGNVHQFLLLGQTDRTDTVELGNSLELSNFVIDKILGFETPANLPPENRYSSFVQILRTQNTITGVGRNRLTSKQLKML